MQCGEPATHVGNLMEIPLDKAFPSFPTTDSTALLLRDCATCVHISSDKGSTSTGATYPEDLHPFSLNLLGVSQISL
jgi:hypothetical protein